MPKCYRMHKAKKAKNKENHSEITACVFYTKTCRRVDLLLSNGKQSPVLFTRRNSRQKRECEIYVVWRSSGERIGATYVRTRSKKGGRWTAGVTLKCLPRVQSAWGKIITKLICLPFLKYRRPYIKVSQS